MKLLSLLIKRNYNFEKIKLNNQPPFKKNLVQKTTYKDYTRQIAFDAICQLFEWKQFSLEAAIQQVLPSNVEQRDKAAAYRLIVCFLRKKGTLEALVESFLKRSPPQKILWIIGLGAAQILFLNTSLHAAINTSVELARHNGFVKFTGLVNAVLRRISDQGQIMLDKLDQNRLDIPVWLWKVWSKAGFDPCRLAEMLNKEPPLDIHFKKDFTVHQDGKKLIDNHWRFPCHVKVDQIEGYQKGCFWVQDIAASLPALLLNVQKNEKVADLCAAPGGKTAQLIETGAKVVAVEKKESRLKRLKGNLDRLNMQAELVLGDAGNLPYKDEFDAILLDAPCSATGIYRRHPDVLRLKRESDVQNLIVLQQKLIKATITYLKKGGRFIYSVCSLHPAEAEEQMSYIQTLSGVRPLFFTQEEIAFLPQALTREGWIRTLPFMWYDKGGMDGFFIARFVKEN